MKLFFWARNKRSKRPKKKQSPAARRHYLLHKEDTRQLVHAKLKHWNQYYGFNYNQVRIKLVSTRWGSCSSKKNLNFNYQILFLPEHLQDYIIVHELCHLKELNHSARFWSLVEQTIPNYRQCVSELKTLHVRIH